MSVLGIGDSVTIDYTNAPYYVFDIKTGKIVTDPGELARVETEIKARRAKLLKELKGDK